MNVLQLVDRQQARLLGDLDDFLDGRQDTVDPVHAAVRIAARIQGYLRAEARTLLTSLAAIDPPSAGRALARRRRLRERVADVLRLSEATEHDVLLRTSMLRVQARACFGRECIELSRVIERHFSAGEQGLLGGEMLLQFVGMRRDTRMPEACMHPLFSGVNRIWVRIAARGRRTAPAAGRCLPTLTDVVTRPTAGRGVPLLWK